VINYYKNYALHTFQISPIEYPHWLEDVRFYQSKVGFDYIRYLKTCFWRIERLRTANLNPK